LAKKTILQDKLDSTEEGVVLQCEYNTPTLHALPQQRCSRFPPSPNTFSALGPLYPPGGNHALDSCSTLDIVWCRHWIAVFGSRPPGHYSVDTLISSALVFCWALLCLPLIQHCLPSSRPSNMSDGWCWTGLEALHTAASSGCGQSSTSACRTVGKSATCAQ